MVRIGWFGESTVTGHLSNDLTRKAPPCPRRPTTPQLLPPPPPADLNRRTILQGAAWTIPAIAVATVAPAASASTNAVLAFNQASYSGTACSTITSAYVTVTVGGVATAGRSVTTTLSGGYTFSGGSTTNTQVSDANGHINLPAITVPASGGTGTITASSAGTSSSAASLGSPAIVTIGNTSGDTYAALPSGVTATAVSGTVANNIYYTYIVGSDGYAYRSDNGGTWAKVSSAGVTDLMPWPGTTFATYITSSGVGNTSGDTYAALPSGVTATAVSGTVANNIYYTYIVGSDGYAYRSDNGGTWAKVSSAGVTHLMPWPGTTFATYSTSAGVVATTSGGTYAALPAGVSVTSLSGTTANGIARTYIVGSDGYAYRSDNGGTWAKVSSAGVTDLMPWPGTTFATYITSSGVGNTSGDTYAALPSGVTATAVSGTVANNIYYTYIVGSDGYAYRSDNGGTWAKVSSAGVTHLMPWPGTTFATYSLQATCS